LLKTRFPLLWGQNPDSLKDKGASVTINNFDLSGYSLEELELMKKLGLGKQAPQTYIQD